MDKTLIDVRLYMSLLILLVLQGCMKGSSEYDHGINEADKIFISQGLHLHEIIAAASALVPERSDSDELEIFAANSHRQQLMLFHELDSVNNFIQLKAGAETNLANLEMNNKLVSLTGNRFDSSYLHNMLIFHQKAVEVYKNQLTVGSNSSLKNFASRKIEFLNTQLQEVEFVFKRYQ